MTFMAPSHAASRSSAPRLARAVAALRRLTGIWRQRQALRRLDGDALRDIGITRSMAEAEASRKFWDAPETWRS